MDEVSLNSEHVYDEELEEFEIGGECTMTEFIGQNGVLQGENPLPPAVGMEFESYEDVYYFYNCYAKEQGFGVRVSNTWYRKSRERYRGKLSCSNAGFKKKSEANRPRPETRTGCPAMIKFRLMDNKRWRLIEVELEHNHLISPTSGKFYKSHRIVDLGGKRPLQIDRAEEVQKIRLFRTVIIDAGDNRNMDGDEGECQTNGDIPSNQLKFNQGDARAMHDFFALMQLKFPEFFYVMDINEKGYLRNVFWADPKAKVRYSYFGDIMMIDTTSLREKYEMPLVVFNGLNHHGQSVPLGCGLVAGKTIDSFIWLFRAWLTYMAGRSPQTIITDQCESLQSALADVFPRASHCLSLSGILKRLASELGSLQDYEAIKLAFYEAVYGSLKVDKFESAWESMLQCYEIRNQKWLQSLYEDRKLWVPAYLKDTYLAGMFGTKPREEVPSPFARYLDKHTSFKEFFGSYEQALAEIDQREALADLDSRDPSHMLKSRFCFELQLSKLYTNNILENFQVEVEGMLSCFSTRQASTDGPITTYLVKEHAEVQDNERETKDFEVVYNTSDMEVLCDCGLFNSKGYLCRHVLSVLNIIGVDEIPPQYILSRWRKDINRSYVPDHFCEAIDIGNPIHRYDHLHKCVMKVVEEGRKSHHRYNFTLQEIDEILNKVQLGGV